MPSIEETVHQFWKLDSVPDIEEKVNDEDLYVENHSIQNVTRDKEGRYSVSLPFKPGTGSPQSNENIALRNFTKLESSLTKDDKKHKEYHGFMQEFFELGHLDKGTNDSNYYLPQLCVTKELSTTTKTRVVFNASSKDCTGLSLNDRLLTGPDLLKDITHVLTNFRLHQVVIGCDIKMAYRQISIHKDDRKFQQILYRKHPEEELQVFKSNRLLYGLAPSAYICQKVIQKLAEDEGDEFPLARNAIENDIYVDNILSGAEDIQSAITLKNQLIKTFNLGKFELRKFFSSCGEVLSDLKEKDLETPIRFNNDDIVKVLGIQYIPKTDSFNFSFNQFNEPVTRRNVLSYISRIYDPLQLLGPIVFKAKCLLQKCFIGYKDYGWDGILPKEFSLEWLDFVHDLSQTCQLYIDRRIPTTNGTISLIGFCDASAKGCGCCLYLLCQLNNQYCVHLLAAKSRVAPIKPTTIPRLELAGSLLLAKMAQHALSNSFLKCDKHIMFCDSQIVLWWIKTDSLKLERFIANRIQKIQNISSDLNMEWRYVPTKQNLADPISRGQTATEFCKSSHEWWYGNSFTNVPITQIPNLDLDIQNAGNGVQVKPLSLMTTKEHCKQENYLYTSASKFSSFPRACKVFALILRFIDRCRSNQINIKSYVQELNSSEKLLVKLSQEHWFDNEIKLLKKGQSPGKKFEALSPFLDEDGLLRVLGRLENAKVSYNQKHPYILHKDCHLSHIIMKHIHVSNFHVGPTMTKGLTRQRFWIISSHTLARKIINKCVKCRRFSGDVFQPPQGNLPLSRTTPVRAFYYCGLDMAGPFQIKASRLRNSKILKGWVLILVCQTVRAVHMELCTELSSECFIAALHRFVSRRGLPAKIYCDNGTNFVGGKNQIYEAIKFLKDNEDTVNAALSSLNIEFSFIPPFSPSMGGSWEAQVKLFKNLFYKKVGARALTYEEFYTILARIEAIINQRPLLELSEGIDAINYLSPSHFLIQSPLHAIPELPIPEKTTLKSRWKYLNQVTQGYWREYNKTYLNNITQRTKTKKRDKKYSPNLNDLVYITDMYTSPLDYPIGKVVKLHPGNDGVVRVVSILLSSQNIVKRATNKLILFLSQ